MSGALTTYSDINQRTTAYAEAKALKHAEPILCLEKFAMVRPLPKNKANNMKFRRAVPFGVDPSNYLLQEGITPPPETIQYEDVTVVMQQYGSWSPITDVVMNLNEDPVLNDIAELMGEQAAEVKERILWGVIRGGTTVFYGSSSDSARTDVNDEITIDRQRAVVRYLKNQRAHMITSMLAAGPNIATVPVPASYVAFTHTDVERDLRLMDNFTPVEQYSQSMKTLHDWELGMAEGVRYIATPVLTPFLAAGSGTANGMKTTNSVVDVYPVVYVGKEAFAAVPLKGENSMSPRVKNPGEISESDPLGQRGFASWKIWFAAVILNETWMARLEVGVTGLGEPQ